MYTSIVRNIIINFHTTKPVIFKKIPRNALVKYQKQKSDTNYSLNNNEILSQFQNPYNIKMQMKVATCFH